jgi:hypothetical protein
MGHVAGMEERCAHKGFGGGNLKEINHLEDLNVDGRIILKCVIKK